MGRFRDANDFIMIEDGVGEELFLPFSFFMTQEPLYNLPAPYITRYYEQPNNHLLNTSVSAFGGPIPYTDGDSYIAKKALYESAYYDFLNPEPTLEEAKFTRINETREYSDNIKEGKIVYGGNTHLSLDSFLQRVRDEFERFTRVASLPGGYYVLDENDVQISFTVLSNLSDLIDKILELWYLCDVNEDYHRAQINALLTVAAVQSYDFTTGWVTVPYN